MLLETFPSCFEHFQDLASDSLTEEIEKDLLIALSQVCYYFLLIHHCTRFLPFPFKVFLFLEILNLSLFTILGFQTS